MVMDAAQAQGLKNEVREALDRLVEACTSLHDCLKGSYVALERPWNISDARKGVSDVLALAHLGGYSLFAPPWYSPTEPLVGHRHAAPHAEMMQSLLHDYAKRMQRKQEIEEEIRAMERHRQAAQARAAQQAKAEGLDEDVEMREAQAGAAEAPGGGEAPGRPKEAEEVEDDAAENNWMFEFGEAESVSSAEEESSDDLEQESE